MDAEVLLKEKDFLEVKFKGMDEGLANLLVETIAKEKVDFVAYTLEHPLTGNPIIRVKSSNPSKSLSAAAKEIEEEAAAALKALPK